MLRRSAALFRHEVRYLVASAPVTLAYVVVPYVLMAFIKNSYGVFLQSNPGYPSASGAEIVAPGVAALYGYLVLSHEGLFTFNEHQWNVWDRLRSGPASVPEIVTGKVGAHLAHQALQFTLILGGAGLLFGLSVGDAWAAVVLLGLLTVTSTVAWGWLGVALVPTSTLFDAWAFGGGILLAALGGAIVPTDLLPDVVRRIGPISPIHWAVKGFRTVFLDGGGLADVGRPLLVLAAFTAGFTLLALGLFDSGRPKVGRLQ